MPMALITETSRCIFFALNFCIIYLARNKAVARSTWHVIISDETACIEILAIAVITARLIICPGNMPGSVLRSRVSRSAMERGLQIKVHGLLWTVTVHTETDLYHR